MMLEGAKVYTTKDRILRWVPSVIIIPVAIYFLSQYGKFSLLDNFDLIIHEAGHVFFSFFGETMYILGGTLMQIIVPALLIAYGLLSMQRVIFQVSVCLLAQNLINISVYAGDAMTQKLRLFGPPGAKHDWHTILTKYNILQYTGDISMFFLVMAGIMFLIAILSPLFIKD